MISKVDITIGFLVKYLDNPYCIHCEKIFDISRELHLAYRIEIPLGMNGEYVQTVNTPTKYVNDVRLFFHPECFRSMTGNMFQMNLNFDTLK